MEKIEFENFSKNRNFRFLKILKFSIFENFDFLNFRNFRFLKILKFSIFDFFRKNIFHPDFFNDPDCVSRVPENFLGHSTTSSE